VRRAGRSAACRVFGGTAIADSLHPIRRSSACRTIPLSTSRSFRSAQKSGSDQVKQFGTRMVDDHSKANDDLKQVASSKGIPLPSALDSEHKSKMAKLEKLSGAQFDRAYMDDMVSDHKKDVAEFEKQAKSGNDADIKGFASKTLPTLQQHLSLAESTDKAVKGGK
jgi:putative membrane protein